MRRKGGELHGAPPLGVNRERGGDREGGRGEGTHLIAEDGVKRRGQNTAKTSGSGGEDVLSYQSGGLSGAVELRHNKKTPLTCIEKSLFTPLFTASFSKKALAMATRSIMCFELEQHAGQRSFCAEVHLLPSRRSYVFSL